MITILKGPAAALARHSLVIEAAARRDAIVLDGQPGYRVPFAGARRLLAWLRRRFGETLAGHAVGRQRALLSLTLRPLEPSLSAGDREARRAVAQRPRIEPLVEAWALCLADMIEDRSVVAVIRHTGYIDGETLAVLHRAKRWVGASLKLVIGQPDDFETEHAVWGQVFAANRRRVGLLEGLDDAKTQVVAGAGGPYEPAPIDEVESDPLDDGLEQAAWAALDGEGPPDRTVVLAGLRAAREGLGFAAARALADALGEVEEPRPAGQGPYFEALALMARAGDSEADWEQAERLLRRCRGPEVPAIDVALARHQTLANLVRLAWQRGDRAKARHWSRLFEVSEDAIPLAEKVPVWRSLAVEDHDLAGAHERWRRRLYDAERELDVAAAAEAAGYLSEIATRRGELRAAHEMAQLRLRLVRGMGEEMVRAARADAALAALRDGLLDEAERLAAAPALLACIAARRGDAQAFEARRSESVDPYMLINIDQHVWLAQGLVELGRRDEALFCLERAGGSFLAGVLRLELLPGPEPLRRVLDAAPAALDEAAAWHELPRLLRALIAVGSDAPDAGLTRVLQAAAQRQDCQRLLRVLARPRPELRAG